MSTTPTPNAFLVIARSEQTVTGGPVEVTTYIGSFADQDSAEAHAAEHNARPNVVATVQTLVNPENC